MKRAKIVSRIIKLRSSLLTYFFDKIGNGGKKDNV